MIFQNHSGPYLFFQKNIGLLPSMSLAQTDKPIKPECFHCCVSSNAQRAVARIDHSELKLSCVLHSEQSSMTCCIRNVVRQTSNDFVVST